MRRKRFLIALLATLISGCTDYDRRPKTMFVEEAYFTCSKCGSMHGGIFGKGPTKELSAPDANRCVHDWRRISKEQFMTLAVERFDVDWSQEAYYWNGAKEGQDPAGTPSSETRAPAASATGSRP